MVEMVFLVSVIMIVFFCFKVWFVRGDVYVVLKDNFFYF